MRAGRLDRIVKLRTKTVTGQDDFGEEEVTWTETDVWAERRELRGDERWTAQQTVSNVACIYRIYYRTDVDVEDQLEDGTDIYDIHAALEVGRREGLELVVTHRGGN